MPRPRRWLSVTALALSLSACALLLKTDAYTPNVKAPEGLEILCAPIEEPAPSAAQREDLARRERAKERELARSRRRAYSWYSGLIYELQVRIAALEEQPRPQPMSAYFESEFWINSRMLELYQRR